MALDLTENRRSNNNILRKPVVTHANFEVVINTDGQIMHYLTQKPKHDTLIKYFIKQPIKITSMLIPDKAFATIRKDGTWVVKKLEQY